MTSGGIAEAARAERERAREDMRRIWEWCSGGHHDHQLQNEFRERRAKGKPKNKEIAKGRVDRAREFAAAVEALGIEAFTVMQAIASGQELIHTYGQVIARAAQLGFITWQDKLEAGVNYLDAQAKKGAGGAKKRWSKNESKIEVDRIIEKLRRPPFDEYKHAERWAEFLGFLDLSELQPKEMIDGKNDRKTVVHYLGGKITFSAFRGKFSKSL